MEVAGICCRCKQVYQLILQVRKWYPMLYGSFIEFGTVLLNKDGVLMITELTDPPAWLRVSQYGFQLGDYVLLSDYFQSPEAGPSDPVSPTCVILID